MSLRNVKIFVPCRRQRKSVHAKRQSIFSRTESCTSGGGGLYPPQKKRAFDQYPRSWIKFTFRSSLSEVFMLSIAAESDRQSSALASTLENLKFNVDLFVYPQYKPDTTQKISKSEHLSAHTHTHTFSKKKVLETKAIQLQLCAARSRISWRPCLQATFLHLVRLRTHRTHAKTTVSPTWE